VTEIFTVIPTASGVPIKIKGCALSEGFPPKDGNSRDDCATLTVQVS
jgi:hypothetical protein